MIAIDFDHGASFSDIRLEDAANAMKGQYEASAVCSTPARIKKSDVAYSSVTRSWSLDETPNQWTRGLQREFEKLTDKSIDELITEKEEARLEELTYWRRILVAPRTIEEMVREAELAERVRDLSLALDKCVVFYEEQG